MRTMVFLLLFAGLLPARAEQVLFSSGFSRGLSNGWKNVPLFQQLTDYTVLCKGTNFYVHAAASNSCSACSAKLNLAPPSRLKLRWRWRIAGVNTNGSERDLKRFDHAARLFVAFHTFIGPPRTLNYLWANVEKPGTMLAHPLSGRAEIFVVESGGAKTGRWLAEERDVTADWERAFPGKAMPRIVGLGLLTDGDSLKTRLSADYADIELLSE